MARWARVRSTSPPPPPPLSTASFENDDGLTSNGDGGLHENYAVADSADGKSPATAGAVAIPSIRDGDDVSSDGDSATFVTDRTFASETDVSNGSGGGGGVGGSDRAKLIPNDDGDESDESAPYEGTHDRRRGRRRRAAVLALSAIVAAAAVVLGLHFGGKLGAVGRGGGAAVAAAHEGAGGAVTVAGDDTTGGGDVNEGGGAAEKEGDASEIDVGEGDSGGGEEYSSPRSSGEESMSTDVGDEEPEANYERVAPDRGEDPDGENVGKAANSVADPTSFPTSEPTSVPTTEPTSVPTSVPTTLTTDEPTSASPTVSPSTRRPTLSPAPTPRPTAPLPPLRYSGDGYTNLRLCRGDCDYDSDCRGGLVCMQRWSNETVPGCSSVDEYGEEAGDDEVDYCVEPRSPLLTETWWESHLGLCEGDCDEDRDCRGALRCFQRDYRESVPGCDGSGWDGWDYCYDPKSSNDNQASDRSNTVGRQKFKTFSFYVMGDAPYTRKEEKLFSSQLRDMYDDHEDGPSLGSAAFAVHVGDIFRAFRYDCARERYSYTRNQFRRYSPDLPVLLTPGDNEWAGECSGDPDRGRRYFSEYFDDLEEYWEDVSDVPGKVRRQWSRRENFALVHEGVLFLSINMVKGEEDGYRDRLRDNAKWIDEHIDEYFSLDDDAGGPMHRPGATPIRSIFIFGHSPFPLSFFEEEIAERYSRALTHLEVPVFYIHGNGHEYEVERTFADEYSSSGRRWRDYFRIQVDRGGYAPPIRVTVRGDEEEALREPFYEEDEHQVVLGRIVKVDRRGGLYDER